MRGAVLALCRLKIAEFSAELGKFGKVGLAVLLGDLDSHAACWAGARQGSCRKQMGRVLHRSSAACMRMFDRWLRLCTICDLQAVEIFEEAAKRAVENNLLKFSARGYLLNAGACSAGQGACYACDIAQGWLGMPRRARAMAGLGLGLESRMNGVVSGRREGACGPMQEPMSHSFLRLCLRPPDSRALPYITSTPMQCTGICVFCYATLETIESKIEKYRDIDLQFKDSREDMLLSVSGRQHSSVSNSACEPLVQLHGAGRCSRLG